MVFVILVVFIVKILLFIVRFFDVCYNFINFIAFFV